MRAYIYAILLLLLLFGAIGGYIGMRFAAFADMDFEQPPVTIAADVAEPER